jgi:hypothetical protein
VNDVCDAVIIRTNQNDSVITFLHKKQMGSCLRYFFPGQGRQLGSLMSGGTTSPIVSGAFAGAFGTAISLTFSLMMCRCSSVRLIVRGTADLS